jgi:hypothetical protein
MSNATSAKSRKAGMLAMALGLGMAAALGHATQDTQKKRVTGHGRSDDPRCRA